MSWCVPSLLPPQYLCSLCVQLALPTSGVRWPFPWALASPLLMPNELLVWVTALTGVSPYFAGKTLRGERKQQTVVLVRR